MASIAVIPARGGSKRIPRKNIKDFCGSPIIRYSIDAARNAGVFDEVMVSTEDEEIADVARRYGASVPFYRSAKTADDHATIDDVLLEVFSRYSELGREFDRACLIYSTAPLVDPARIREGMQMLEKGAAHVLSVTRFSYPVQRAHVIDSSGQLRYKWEKYYTFRSQDLEPFYHDAGQFSCVDVKKFMETGGALKEGSYPIIIPESQVQDIDTMEDWKLAEMKYALMTGKRERI